MEELSNQFENYAHYLTGGDYFGLLAFLTLFMYIVPTYLWASHEAQLLVIKRLAMSIKGYDAIKAPDRWTKIFMSSIVVTFIVIVAVLLVVLTGNDWFILTFPVMAFAARWFFGEGFYGMLIGQGFLHVGTGGRFDNEIAKGRKNFYFWLRFFILLAATLAMFLLRNS